MFALIVLLVALVVGSAIISFFKSGKKSKSSLDYKLIAKMEYDTWGQVFTEIPGEGIMKKPIILGSGIEIYSPNGVIDEMIGKNLWENEYRGSSYCSNDPWNMLSKEVQQSWIEAAKRRKREYIDSAFPFGLPSSI